MKIRVEFNAEEKVALLNALEVTGKDESEEVTGNFGSLKYDHEKDYIEINLKTVFIQASSNLIGICINTIKSLINSFKMFELTWLKDQVSTTDNSNMSKEDRDNINEMKFNGFEEDHETESYDIKDPTLD